MTALFRRKEKLSYDSSPVDAHSNWSVGPGSVNLAPKMPNFTFPINLTSSNSNARVKLPENWEELTPDEIDTLNQSHPEMVEEMVRITLEREGKEPDLVL